MRSLNAASSAAAVPITAAFGCVVFSWPFTEWFSTHATITSAWSDTHSFANEREFLWVIIPVSSELLLSNSGGSQKVGRRAEGGHRFEENWSPPVGSNSAGGVNKQSAG